MFDNKFLSCLNILIKCILKNSDRNLDNNFVYISFLIDLKRYCLCFINIIENLIKKNLFLWIVQKIC